MAEQDDKKNDGKNDDRKVVEFPLHKARKPKPADPAVPVEGDTEAPTTSQRKKAMVVSLMSVLVVATFLSAHVGTNRVPQSADDRPDLEQDIITAKKINHSSLREPASGGREPTAEDILRHSELANFYSLQFTPEGALKSVDFSPASGGSLRKIEAREAFLNKYKELFRIPFEEIRRIPSSTQNDEHTYELYEMVHDSRVVARVHFTLSAGETLNSMKVEQLNTEK